MVDKKDVYSRITDKIIADLEQGVERSRYRGETPLSNQF